MSNEQYNELKGRYTTSFSTAISSLQNKNNKNHPWFNSEISLYGDIVICQTKNNIKLTENWRNIINLVNKKLNEELCIKYNIPERNRNSSIV